MSHGPNDRKLNSSGRKAGAIELRQTKALDRCESNLQCPVLYSEDVIQLDAEASLVRLEAVQFSLLPAVVEHKKELIAGL